MRNQKQEQQKGLQGLPEHRHSSKDDTSKPGLLLSKEIPSIVGNSYSPSPGLLSGWHSWEFLFAKPRSVIRVAPSSERAILQIETKEAISH